MAETRTVRSAMQHLQVSAPDDQVACLRHISAMPPFVMTADVNRYALSSLGEFSERMIIPI
jgi:hypothetical protein